MILSNTPNALPTAAAPRLSRVAALAALFGRELQIPPRLNGTPDRKDHECDDDQRDQKVVVEGHGEPTFHQKTPVGESLSRRGR
jgi:hypothetical protein